MIKIKTARKLTMTNSYFLPLYILPLNAIFPKKRGKNSIQIPLNFYRDKVTITISYLLHLIFYF